MTVETLKVLTDLRGWRRGVWRGPGRRSGRCTVGPDSEGPPPPGPWALGYWTSADLKHTHIYHIKPACDAPDQPLDHTDDDSLEMPFPMSSAYWLRSSVRDANIEEIAGGKTDNRDGHIQNYSEINNQYSNK